MRRKRPVPLLFTAVVLALSFLACNAPPPPSPTSLPSLPSPTVLPSLPSPTILPSLTSLPSPTVPPSPPSPVLPAGTTALYTALAWESVRLYALAADGTATDLGQEALGWAAVSRTGRWTVRPGSPYPVDSLVIVNLADGTTYTVPATPGFEVHGAAFDAAETRAAFLELEPLTLVKSIGRGSTRMGRISRILCSYPCSSV